MNSTNPKHSVICSFLGQTQDRFHKYNQVLDLEGKLELASQIQGISGVEIVYPYETDNEEQLTSLLKKHNLGLSAINVNIKGEPEFRDGGLTAKTKEVREKAVYFIKQGKDFAKRVGADKVTCCPLNDGYEFNFNCNYAETWSYMVEALHDAGSYLPEIPLYIEYKPSETRGHCFIDSAAKTIVLLNAIGLKGMGVTVDVGHSIYGNENPAEAVTLLAENKYPFYVHINDNDGRWDWDYMAGTKHFIDYVEFLYYLQEYGYDDYLTSDTSPTRWDIKGTFEINTRFTNRIWNRLQQLDREKLRSLLSARNYIETWGFIEDNFFKLD